MASPTQTPLRALLDLLNSNAEALEAAYTKANVPFPSLDEPFKGPTPLDFDPSVVQARSLIVAAAAQLIATVRFPIESLQMETGSFYSTAALGVIEETNVVEILAEAGDKGLHVNNISAQSGIDSAYLGRLLRYLATRHFFKEITPNVFTNNRLSSLLHKRKSVAQIKANPDSKYEEAPLASFVATFGDDGLKTAPYLSPFLQRKVTGATPFNAAFNTDKPIFIWLDEPGNEERNRRVTAVMRGIAHQYPPDIFTSAVKELNLKSGDVVVDVGGSVGSATLVLFKEFPDLQYFVQDLQKPIQEAHSYWEQNNADAVKSGKVILQTHNFLDPQPVQGAALYFLRFIIHDLDDDSAKKLLTRLREAAAPTTKILAFDNIATHTCKEEVPLPGIPEAPYPLLANRGIAGGGFLTTLDLGNMTTVGGKERTRAEWEELGRATGWKLDVVKPGKLAQFIYSLA